MANFIAIIDRDGGRRREFLRDARGSIAPVGGLRVGDLAAGNFAAVWAAEPRAPISTAFSSSSAAVIWGDAIPGPGPERLDAGSLGTKWKTLHSVPPAAFDGFHAAVSYDERSGLIAAADLLGLFPVYYAVSGDTLLLGSSPQLFQKHPLFPARLSRDGLVGILMTYGLFEGKGLLCGVHRLQPAHALKWRPGTSPMEVKQYAIPFPIPGRRESIEEDIYRLDTAFCDAVRRHMPVGENAAILLSGGRDSRQIAGYLSERSDRIEALTFGESTDYDMICATAVGRALRIDHRVERLDESQLPMAAALQVRWEHLGSGFANVHMWNAVPALRDFPARFISGYLSDVYETKGRPVAFDEVFGSAEHRGMQVSTLRRLLLPAVFDGLIDEIQHRARSVYEASCTLERQRPWRFFFAHDGRAHAGAVPWKLSFGSWPVLPILDRGLLEAIFSLSEQSLFHRRAQDEILRRRFPRLASLPLDRNAHDTTPLLPSAHQRIARWFNKTIEPVRRRVPRKRERRHYHRIYDINGPGWRAVRRSAEPNRDLLADLLNMDVMREILPPPDSTITVVNKIRDSYAPKQLLALILWSARDMS